jgi:hypothetical protein
VFDLVLGRPIVAGQSLPLVVAAGLSFVVLLAYHLLNININNFNTSLT